MYKVIGFRRREGVHGYRVQEEGECTWLEGSGGGRVYMVRVQEEGECTWL